MLVNGAPGNNENTIQPIWFIAAWWPRFTPRYNIFCCMQFGKINDRKRQFIFSSLKLLNTCINDYSTRTLVLRFHSLFLAEYGLIVFDCVQHYYSTHTLCYSCWKPNKQHWYNCMILCINFVYWSNKLNCCCMCYSVRHNICIFVLFCLFSYFD